MSITRKQLLASATEFCNAIATHQPIETILTHFSSTYAISVLEHGTPPLAPFIGRQFTRPKGLNSVEAYFKLLQKHVKHEDMQFGAWVVDVETRRVACKGYGKFTWIEGPGDGQAWEEQFAYILDMDQDGKITDYQVFADSGAAYLARKGKLADELKEYNKDRKR